jgi:hypothetical protein
MAGKYRPFRAGAARTSKFVDQYSMFIATMVENHS